MVGRFEIQSDIFYENWEVTSKLMSQMAIIRCEFLQYKNVFEYMAYSPLFESMVDGAEPPYYDIIIHKNDNEIVVQARKRDSL